MINLLAKCVTYVLLIVFNLYINNNNDNNLNYKKLFCEKIEDSLNVLSIIFLVVKSDHNMR